MALGWCMSCETLRTIRPGPQKWGSRECAWFPIEHDAPARHRGCGGRIEQVDETTFACDQCGGNELGLIYPDEVEPGKPCSGHKREIK